MRRIIQFEGRWKPLVVAVGPADKPPFPVEAEVLEEDTYLALSADPAPRLLDEHPIRVLAESYAARPQAPGTVVVRPGRPLRLLAIVHRLDEEPTWREEWVAGALEGVFAEVDRRGLRSLKLPLLGSVHGRLPIERFLDRLGRLLHAAPPESLERVWLCCGPHPPAKILILLS